MALPLFSQQPPFRDWRCGEAHTPSAQGANQRRLHMLCGQGVLLPRRSGDCARGKNLVPLRVYSYTLTVVQGEVSISVLEALLVSFPTRGPVCR